MGPGLVILAPLKFFSFSRGALFGEFRPTVARASCLPVGGYSLGSGSKLLEFRTGGGAKFISRGTLFVADNCGLRMSDCGLGEAGLPNLSGSPRLQGAQNVWVCVVRMCRNLNT